MRIHVTKPEAYAFGIVLIINILMYSSIIKLPGLSYLDEALTLFFSGVVVCNRKVKGESNKILYYILLFYFLGIVSSLFSNNISSFAGACIDAFSFLKWPLTFIFISYYLSNKVKKAVVDIMAFIGGIMLMVTCACAVINFAADINMTFDVRWGIRSFKFIFNNPAALNETNLIYFCCIARVAGEKKRTIFFVLFAVCTVFTMRSTGLGVIAIYILIAATLKFVRYLKPWHFILPTLAALITAWSQIQNYLLSTHIRSIMYVNGFRLALERFPLGEGFATFGSDQAYKLNSPIYVRLGFNMASFYNYRNDNFWPMILGQSGFFGMILYMMLLLYILKIILGSRHDKRIIMLMSICWIEMFISSIGNAIYTGVGSVLIFGTIAFLNYRDENEGENIEKKNRNHYNPKR